MIRERKTLTKSLHTVTVVANVARLILSMGNHRRTPTLPDLLEQSLGVLGFDVHAFSKDDDTVARCRDAISKVLLGE